MEEILPTAKYKIAEAARLMGISRTSLYNHIKNGIVRTNAKRIKGKMRKYVQGLEIIRYNTCVQGTYFTNVKL